MQRSLEKRKREKPIENDDETLSKKKRVIPLVLGAGCGWQ